MFKLSIQFATIAHLSAFVTKMGSDVLHGEIEHTQPINDGASVHQVSAAPTVASSETLTPQQKAAATRAAKKAAAQEAPATPVQPQQAASPFPGGFTPGGAPQPAPQLVHNAPAAAPASAPVVAPVAQAPVAAPVAAAPLSAERKAANDNCAQLIKYLEQGGTARGYTPEQLGQVISNSMAEAGIQPGTRILEMSDIQIQTFYPILYKNVLAAVPQG